MAENMYDITPLEGEQEIHIPLGGHTLIVDAEGFALAASRHWDIIASGNTRYAGYKEASGHYVYLHRLLMGDPVDLEIDHEDGNGLNNTYSNLRVATTAQNQANRRLAKNNASGYKGVSVSAGHFVAQLAGTYLGTFPAPEQAAAAYDRAAVEAYGAFARTNESLGLL